ILDFRFRLGMLMDRHPRPGGQPKRTHCDSLSRPRRPPIANHQSKIKYPLGEGLMEKIDEGLKTLLDQGKEKGYLTYGQVNDYLPDNAVNPEKLDQLLVLLEEEGIELIDESEAEERERGAPEGPEADEELRAELELAAYVDEEDGRRIDDPVRMYLT